MSIILDALKKADENKENSSDTENQNSESSDVKTESQDIEIEKSSENQISSPPPKNPFGPSKKSNKTRVIVFSVIIVIGVTFIAFNQYTKGGFPFSLFSQKKTNPLAIKKFPTPKPFNKMAAPQKKGLTDKDKKQIDDLKKMALEQFEQNNYEQSLLNYEELIKLTPNDAQVYNNYALVLKKMEKIKLAEENYRKALELEPNYPEALNNLAALKLEQQSYSEVENLLKKALEKKPNYVEPYFHLGLFYEKTGNTSQAINHYQKFINIADDKVERDILLAIEKHMIKLKSR